MLSNSEANGPGCGFLRIRPLTCALSLDLVCFWFFQGSGGEKQRKKMRGFEVCCLSALIPTLLAAGGSVCVSTHALSPDLTFKLAPL